MSSMMPLQIYQWWIIIFWAWPSQPRGHQALGWGWYSWDHKPAQHIYLWDVSNQHQGQQIKDQLTDNWILEKIRTLSKHDKQRTRIMTTAKHPNFSQLEEVVKYYLVKDRILYNHGYMGVPNRNITKAVILKSRHSLKLAGHSEHSKTLALVQDRSMWSSRTDDVNQYIKRCDSYRQVKLAPCTCFQSRQDLWGTSVTIWSLASHYQNHEIHPHINWEAE